MTSNTIKQPLELEELTLDLDTSDDISEPDTKEELQIILTQKKLQQMKSNLLSVIVAINKNKSLISKAAALLDKLPTWGKIAAGLALTLPILIIGLTLHMGVLLLLSGVVAFTCVFGGLLLDEHHQLSTDMTDDLENCLSGIADLMAETIEVLAKTIDALNKIRQDLGDEVNRLQNENNTLNKTNLKMEETAARFDAILQACISNGRELNQNEQASLKRMKDYIEHGEVLIDDFKSLQQQLDTTENKLAITEEKLATVAEKLYQLQLRQEKNIDRLEEQVQKSSISNHHLDLANSPSFFSEKTKPIAVIDNTIANNRQYGNRV